jgi:hypothetical protein
VKPCSSCNLNCRCLLRVIAGLLKPSTVLKIIGQQTLSVLARLLHANSNLSAHGYSNVVTASLISFTVHVHTVGGIVLGVDARC